MSEWLCWSLMLSRRKVAVSQNRESALRCFTPRSAGEAECG